MPAIIGIPAHNSIAGMARSYRHYAHINKTESEVSIPRQAMRKKKPRTRQGFYQHVLI